MTEILAEQTLTGFSYNAEFGTYLYNQIPATFSFTPDDTYKVVWDGIEYTFTARMYTAADGYACIGIGNELLFGGENSGEPFGIVLNTELNYGHFFSLETSESHTVYVYQENEVIPEPEPEQVGTTIVLYDRTGAAVTYEGVETLTTDIPEAGTQAVFTYGEVMEGVEVELALADGDQILSVPKGYLVKKAVIKKPTTLLPENIRKDVNIGGVAGTLIGTGIKKTVDLNMADGDQVVEADKETLMSKVVITKPETLVPENIASGVEIGGVVGTASISQFDVSDELLKYFTYSIDADNQIIFVYKILYNKLYEDTGSCDITIPDKIGNYAVIITI